MPTCPRRTARCSGFTLLEVMIVVAILAIIAGIIYPHYSSHAQEARAASLLSDLQVIRQQITAYQVEHNGRYPRLAQMWGDLTGATDINGNPAANGAFGPYMHTAPKNAFTGGPACAADNTADWQYDEATGAIRAVVPAAVIAEMELVSHDVVAAP